MHQATGSVKSGKGNPHFCLLAFDEEYKYFINLLKRSGIEARFIEDPLGLRGTTYAITVPGVKGEQILVIVDKSTKANEDVLLSMTIDRNQFTSNQAHVLLAYMMDIFIHENTFESRELMTALIQDNPVPSEYLHLSNS